MGGWSAAAQPLVSRAASFPARPFLRGIVPIGSMVAGLALALGLWTRIAAAVALVMVLSLQFGAGAMFRYAYLMDANGLAAGWRAAGADDSEGRGKRKVESGRFAE